MVRQMPPVFSWAVAPPKIDGRASRAPAPPASPVRRKPRLVMIAGISTPPYFAWDKKHETTILPACSQCQERLVRWRESGTSLSSAPNPGEESVFKNECADVGDNGWGDAAVDQRVFVRRRKPLARGEQMVELWIELEFHVGAAAQNFFPVLEVLGRHLVIPASLEDENGPVDL